MDLSSSGINDRLGSLSKVDLPLNKKDESNHAAIIEDSRGDQLVQRCVIIQRGEKGYGLTVSGDNPVFVQSVKEDGAAAHAGVQQGDRIIKVNGTLVTQSNHVEVVKLIKSGSYVSLTLLGRPAISPRSPCNQIGKNQVSNMNSGLHKPSSPSERITGPQPVDSEKMQQLSNSKIHTIRMMLEQELAYLEKLRSEFVKNPIEKIRFELSGAQKRCRTLEEQLFNLTGVRHDCGLSQIPQSPRSQPRHAGNDFTNDKDTPPPLPPPRRFNLPHQMSLPNVTVTENSRHIAANETNSAPVVSPPSPSLCHYHQSAHQQMTISHSMDNIQRVNLPAVMTSSATVPMGIGMRSGRQQMHKKSHSGPTHSRQRSSPDALLHQTESLRQQQMENIRNMDVTRSNSEITCSRKLAASESFGEGDQPKRARTKEIPSRTSSFGTYDSIESPRVTPPGTPPPPYGSSDAMELNDSLIEENFFGPSPSIRSPDSDDPSITGSRLQTPDTPPDCNAAYMGKPGQNPAIISMEDDDFPSDNEMGQADDHGPFNSLTKLWRHPSHLAVFMHFLISNNDPSSLFFYLVSELYKEGTAKEMKKWAYEIHSTFLVPGAPLKVNNIDEAVLHEIDSVLQHDLDKEDILRKLFWKARKKALDELNEQLAEFRNKRTLGLGAFFGPPDLELELSIHDKSRELKIIEKLLVPSMETLSEDIENANNRTCALATSLATLLYKLFGVKSPQAINLIERCPTFVSKEKSRLKVFNRNKKVQMVQGHNFLAQHYFNVTYCNHCQLIIWGVGNQGYQCQNCEMNIHKACVKVVEENCIGALRNKKDKKRDRMSGIMDNIMGKRKPSTASLSGNKLKTPEEIDVHILDGQMDPGDRQFAASRVEKLKNRYETLCEGEEKNCNARETTPPTISPTDASTTNGDSSKFHVINEAQTSDGQRVYEQDISEISCVVFNQWDFVTHIKATVLLFNGTEIYGFGNLNLGAALGLEHFNN
uniref:Rho guanine nucleotide exchange factor 12 n=1 Tax=Strigamia maritima TaxID=126957 RepID=T1J9G7_STRMM